MPPQALHLDLEGSGRQPQHGEEAAVLVFSMAGTFLFVSFQTGPGRAEPGQAMTDSVVRQKQLVVFKGTVCCGHVTLKLSIQYSFLMKTEWVIGDARFHVSNELLERYTHVCNGMDSVDRRPASAHLVVAATQRCHRCITCPSMKLSYGAQRASRAVHTANSSAL